MTLHPPPNIVPCVVCGKRADDNSWEPKFRYVVCPDHAKWPSGAVAAAAADPENKSEWRERYNVDE